MFRLSSLIILLSLIFITLISRTSSRTIKNPATFSKNADSIIKLYFYSPTNQNGIEIDASDSDSLLSTDFASSKPSVFLIHGWTNDYSSPSCQTIKDAYVSSDDINVFIVDWSSLSKQEYDKAQSSVETVGKTLGEHINKLVQNNGLSLDKTGIIGHSLGAHVAGVTGAALDGGAQFIVGLDPAGPGFSLGNTENRLDSSDGKFVQVIHTNSGNYGFSSSLGKADYWPNGGKSQPGCQRDEEPSCSHGRAYLYFAESILTGNFIAKQCESNEAFEAGNCDSNSSSWFGQTKIDTSASGDYYLTTNAASPYAKGD